MNRHEYVALGSSFAAGPGIGRRAPASPRFAGRSTANYARLLASARGLELTDASFSGTTALEIIYGSTRRRSQVDAIHRTTRLVTITTGGNDVGFIGQLWAASAATRKPPLSWRPFCRAPVASRAEAAFDDLPARLDAVVREVRVRAPAALIVLVDYATVLPPTDETSDRLPIDKHQVRRARDIARRLEEVNHHVSKRAGTELVQASRATADHHVDADDPWVQPWTFPATPLHWGPLAYHPTLDGMRAIAAAIDKHLAMQGWS